jgi:hypothetical protein
MPMNKITLPIIIVFLFTLLILNNPVQAGDREYIPPRPPAQNQNPPKTIEDINRVDFARSMVKKLLMQDFTKNKAGSDSKLVNNGQQSYHITQICARMPSCTSQNLLLQKYASSIHKRFGHLSKIRHPHIIPWSFKDFKKNQKKALSAAKDPAMPSKMETKDNDNDGFAPAVHMPRPTLKKNEYLVHIYGRFNGNWHHLDVILSEDKKGQISFERFFIVRMPEKDTDLPEGVDC